MRIPGTHELHDLLEGQGRQPAATWPAQLAVALGDQAYCHPHPGCPDTINRAVEEVRERGISGQTSVCQQLFLQKTRVILGEWLNNYVVFICAYLRIVQYTTVVYATYTSMHNDCIYMTTRISTQICCHIHTRPLARSLIAMCFTYHVHARQAQYFFTRSKYVCTCSVTYGCSRQSAWFQGCLYSRYEKGPPHVPYGAGRSFQRTWCYFQWPKVAKAAQHTFPSFF